MRVAPFHRALLLACLLCLTLPGQAHNAVSEPGSTGSITIDASRLNAVVALDAGWRFSNSDDPRFADPAFDDSAWPVVMAGEDRLLADAHAPDVPDGRCWARLHLHIVNPNGPVAIALASVRNFTPYAVFANGQIIGTTKSFSMGKRYNDQPFLMVLPQEPEVVLAVHFDRPDRPVMHYFPIERFEIGQSEALGYKIDLLRERESGTAKASILEVVLCFVLAPLCLGLLWAQRNHREYFWLAAYFLLTGFEGSLDAGVATSRLSHNWDYLDALMGGGWGVAVQIEFIAQLAHVHRRGLVRAVQGYHLLFPFLIFFGSRLAYNIGDVLGAVLVTILCSWLLLAAYLRGNTECGILFLPFLVVTLQEIVGSIGSEFPTIAPDWLKTLHEIILKSFDPGDSIFILGLVVVVLFRFNRVSKDEQIAAAEFEAARTVQQLLIPATAPATPGFSVESVYIPAQKVGGDFFLILPARMGEEGLLAVMGDVSGKGLQAAMVVSTIIGGLRMQVSREPSEVLGHLNKMLAGNISGFATCCAVLIHRDGRVRIANAGNPPPYCNGEEVRISPGLPLGLVFEMEYVETEHTLEAGQRLTFVSDGVVEATRVKTNELFGFERTKTISAESASAIARAATEFGAGGPQADDITVLTVELA